MLYSHKHSLRSLGKCCFGSSGVLASSSVYLSSEGGKSDCLAYSISNRSYNIHYFQKLSLSKKKLQIKL